jgi:hypothetical protein
VPFCFVAKLQPPRPSLHPLLTLPRPRPSLHSRSVL